MVDELNRFIQRKGAVSKVKTFEQLLFISIMDFEGMYLLPVAVES
jgi:hypothetical protein